MDSQTMDADTLLTRQMELHTSVRKPPTNPDQLIQLRDNMRNFYIFFTKLKEYSTTLGTEVDTLFQCFMYISIGGAVNFDAQGQDGAVPMHQAKVLTREAAIELEPIVREKIPHEELMVYVGLSRDIRTALRVKIEDGNDIRSAEKSVEGAVQYLNYIDKIAKGEKNLLYKFYMVEDEKALVDMLDECGDEEFMSTYRETHPGYSGSRRNTLTEDFEGTINVVPLPPLNTVLKELTNRAKIVVNTSEKVAARQKALVTMNSWIEELPDDFVEINALELLKVSAEPAKVMVREKRSAFCRAGCDLITAVMNRVTREKNFKDELNKPNCAVANIFTDWTNALTKGVYVTVAAIALAVDKALRELCIMSYGHPAVVRALLTALEQGSQTELRRKCLGYLSLCVCATEENEKGSFKPLYSTVTDAAIKYVEVGDSPSRKMARALCAVLESASGHAVPVTNEKTVKLIALEKLHIMDMFKGGPRALEGVLFESNELISSMRPSLAKNTKSPKSGSTPTNLDDRPLPPPPASGNRSNPGVPISLQQKKRKPEGDSVGSGNAKLSSSLQKKIHKPSQ